MRRLLKLSAALLLAAPLTAQAVPTGVSGREAHPGLRIGEITYNATFAGWTTANRTGRSDWYPIYQTDGGSWSATFTYRGTARVAGEGVDLLAGYWLMDAPDGPSGGMVTGGTVTWPDATATAAEWPCWSSTNNYASNSYPVAMVDAELLDGQNRRGTLTGCLDDIGWDPDRPLEAVPWVWGVIDVGEVPQPGSGAPVNGTWMENGFGMR